MRPHGDGYRMEMLASACLYDSSDLEIGNRSFGVSASPLAANARRSRVQHMCEASVFEDACDHPHHHCIVQACGGHAIETRIQRWRRNRASLHSLDR